ncbi:Sporulation initiation phosphotransferase F [Posidoniimonas polymericola]|uniref:Sporulation initiation phosphotransferase F n=1 Tax=Posidoniimonas polymericola TaxID=2528002 RepID=A0A5C5YCU2_9BACT|nr:response regulator [Posidoniimonas polymericola]TWT73516.1 Sporulation initiation phosphotransferase F [Posidoniimonas polymericola]
MQDVSDPHSEDQSLTTPTDENRRVLLIDDNHAIHDDYNKILVPARDSGELDELGSLLFEDAAPSRGPAIGFETTSAYQGQEALAIVEKSVEDNRRFAMAFVDMRMPPGWDGLETIKRMWEVDEELQVVICSAYSDHSWNELVDELPKDDQWLLLRKPFDGAEVSQLALALTKKWSLGRETRKSLAQLREALGEREQLLDALGSSTERMCSEYGKIAEHIESSFHAIEVLTRAYQSLDEAATPEGVPAAAWTAAAQQVEAASPQGEMAETLTTARATLDSFKKINATVATMREKAGVGG